MYLWLQIGYQTTNKSVFSYLERIDVISKYLSYDHEKGSLLWIATNYKGREAKTVTSTYKYHKPFIKVVLKGCEFKAHRLAYILFHKKQIPDGIVIDHINGNPLDNRIINLRACTPRQNTQNSSRPISNTSGFKGVSTHRNKYRASIWSNRKHIHLGVFNTKEEARDAYNNAAFNIYGEYARSS